MFSDLPMWLKIAALVPACILLGVGGAAIERWFKR